MPPTPSSRCERHRDHRRRRPPVRAPRRRVGPRDGSARRTRRARRRRDPVGDVQFAYGGSEDGGNADTMVTELGPSGLPFTNVRNGCATGGSALVSAVRTLAIGRVRRRPGRRLRQASARCVPERPGRLVAPRLVRRGRADGHHAVLRREAPALHARLRHLGARRLRRSPRRRSRTARSRLMRGGGSRCRPPRSAPRRCSRTRSRSTCCAHREREQRR